MDPSVKLFSAKLRRRAVSGSYNCAVGTLQFLQAYISNNQWSEIGDLLNDLHDIKKHLEAAAPSELAVGNMMLRVMHMVREEHHTATEMKTGSGLVDVCGPQESGAVSPSAGVSTPGSGATTPRHHGLRGAAVAGSIANVLAGLTKVQRQSLRNPTHGINIKNALLEALGSEIGELEDTMEQISAQSVTHINPGESVLTYGYSRSVAGFLKAASKKYDFSVVVVQAAPGFAGQRMAAELIESKPEWDVTLISASAAFSVMSRVNKVIVGTQYVLADGGLICNAGLHVLAVAANAHSVPYVVCAGIYKLSPVYHHSRDSFQLFESPGTALRVEDRLYDNNVNVICPTSDYVPANLVSLLITGEGGQNPFYMYRLLQDIYDREDVKKSKAQ